VSKIEVGRWAELLKRISGIAGAETVSGHLSPEISPVMLLEDLGDADYLFLKGVRLCSAGTGVNAAAGFTSKYRLRNPADSGAVAVVTALEISPDAGAAQNVTANIHRLTVDLPTAVLTTAQDPRWGTTGGLNQTALIFSTSNAQVTGPAGDVVFDTRTPNGTPYLYTQQIPLLPGSGIDWGTITLNVSFRGWVRWTERTIPDLER